MAGVRFPDLESFVFDLQFCFSVQRKRCVLFLALLGGFKRKKNLKECMFWYSYCLLTATDFTRNESNYYEALISL